MVDIICEMFLFKGYIKELDYNCIIYIVILLLGVIILEKNIFEVLFLFYE